MFGDLDSKLDEAREGNGGTGSSNNDYEEYPRVKLTPEAAIGGTIVDVGFTGDVNDEQNIRGADNWYDEGDFVFTLEDPQVVRGTLFEAALRDEAEDNLAKNLTGDELPFQARTPSRDFRLVPEDWEGAEHVGELVRKLNGEYTPVGVEIQGSEFPGEPTTFDDALVAYDRIEVFVPGQAGRMMMQSVDAMQSRSAYVTDEGDKVQGLIEYPRDYGTNEWSPADGDFPRAAANPVLHPDLEGTEVALYLHFGDLEDAMSEDDEAEDEEDSTGYRKHFGDLLAEIDGETRILTQEDDVLEPTTEPFGDQGRYTWLEFHEVGESEASDGDESAADFGALADAASNGHAENGNEDEDDDEDVFITLDDVDRTTQEFVEQAADIVSEADGFEGAFARDFTVVVEEAQQSGDIPDDDVAPEAIEGLVADVAGVAA